eukprot:CAMPEP_0168251864 /NCGR_PEP_ID=MMETSP0141_2-20121125/3309_1 /TAXON_ID=44445 /ORGANISM="Pseudo-nitzschia australis, Strain 10249 10 AB" /LENGTH=314 /DNA_ID=CAMNT_0008188047 /DNA_START=102 /DNA_END=1046 /DNA_ORIENTATION=+
MKTKLKQFFSTKNLGSEISGSFDGDAAHDSLLGSHKNEDEWDAWSLGKKREKGGDVGRGRLGRREGYKRSQSERPSKRTRSKSEVSKRLKRLESDLTLGFKKKFGGSTSVGGVYKGNSTEIRSKIDALAMERANSDTELEAKVERPKSEPLMSSKPTKKLAEEDEKRRLIKELRRRCVYLSSIFLQIKKIELTEEIKFNEKIELNETFQFKEAIELKGTETKIMVDFPNDIIPSGSGEGANSVSTMTKDSKQKKKKKKSDKEKRRTSQMDDFSIPSKVEMTGNVKVNQGSITVQDNLMHEEPPRPKKGKDKDKS